ncbi:hypothetical protein BC834DRAFT_973420 [Gloeopeniophorella convolvens]|nr:hypothetical protein BC834DRAFT_973420 [Gloeopeniophorella convolvens]
MSMPPSSRLPFEPVVSTPIPPNIAEWTVPIVYYPRYLYVPAAHSGIASSWGHLNWFMYGILLVQVYLYNYYFPCDRRGIKTLVYAIFVVETVQTTLGMADVFYWFANGFGNVPRLNNPYISFVDTPVIAAFISFVIQSFFSYRIWTLENSLWWLVIVIEGISVTQATGGIVGGIKGHLAGNFSQAHRFNVYVNMWLIGDAVADVLIAVSLTYLLLRSRKREYHFSSDNTVAKLIRLTIETNIVSATVAVVALIMFMGWPNHKYFYCPTAVLGKIYSNTLLVTLANRITLRHGIRLRNPGSSHKTHVSVTVHRSTDQFEMLPKTGTAAEVAFRNTRRYEVMHGGFTGPASGPPAVHPAQLHYIEVIDSPGSSEFSPGPAPSSVIEMPSEHS